MAMKMEFVQQQLQEWGELIVTTAGGSVFEIHIGDTKFDTEKRVMILKTADAEITIDGDSIESFKKHLGHPGE